MLILLCVLPGVPCLFPAFVQYTSKPLFEGTRNQAGAILRLSNRDPPHDISCELADRVERRDLGRLRLGFGGLHGAAGVALRAKPQGDQRKRVDLAGGFDVLRRLELLERVRRALAPRTAGTLRVEESLGDQRVLNLLVPLRSGRRLAVAPCGAHGRFLAGLGRSGLLGGGFLAGGLTGGTGFGRGLGASLSFRDGLLGPDRKRGVRLLAERRFFRRGRGFLLVLGGATGAQAEHNPDEDAEP